MNKEFINYEESLELKELGFDGKCFAYYNKDKYFPEFSNGDDYWVNSDFETDSKSDYCTMPLYQQAFRWFREEHDLMHIIIKVGTMEDYVYMSTIDNKRWTYKCNTYTEAELTSLRKLIEIVKNIKKL